MQALRDLASVSPAFVMNALLPRIEAALDTTTVTSPHQALAVLQALPSLVLPLLWPVPHLAPHLPRLLEMCLPGLDPNDPKKAALTTVFFTTVLSWVPIFDPSQPRPARGLYLTLDPKEQADSSLHVHSADGAPRRPPADPVPRFAPSPILAFDGSLEVGEETSECTSRLLRAWL